MWNISTLRLVFPITIGIGVTAALIAWRERDEPGALPLMGMFIGQSIWVTCSLFEIQSQSVQAKVFWSELLWIGVVIIPVAWLLFSLEYTGRDQYVRPRNVLLLFVVPAITIVLALTSQSHDLLYTGSEIVEYQGLVFVDLTIGPWVWVFFGYTYLLGILGSIPLFDLISSEASVFRGQSGALLIGTVVPWASNALYLAGFISVPAFDPTPIAFLVSGLAYLGAVTQFQLFSTTPSASQHAQRLFIDQLQAGVVVVDSHDCIVDLNDSAAAIFGVDSREVLGRKARTVIRQYDTLQGDCTERSCRTLESPETGRQYDIAETEITDTHGRTVGQIFTFHDISAHVRNQQRHQVLNRLFRHNIRTETNLVVSHADLLADEGDDGDPTKIRDSAMQIEETARMARQILDVFEQHTEPTKRVELSGLLDRSIDQIEERYPDVSIESATGDGLYVDGTLDVVLTNVIENAAMHNDAADPRIWIRIEELSEGVKIEVADNGPGIDEYERAVIERGTESALQHSSGLGLWLIKWGTEIAGGELELRDNEPSGTVVSVTVPTVSSASDGSETVEADVE